MRTQCNEKKYEFQGLNSRRVEGKFDGGVITSDGGGLLLREVEKQFGIIHRLAECFTDYRHESYIDHSVEELLAQRIYALALGYEDLNDHDELRNDPLFATVVGKSDPQGNDRIRKRDKGKPLAGSATLNRLELTPDNANSENRYKKIVADFDKINRLFVELFLQMHPEAPERIVLDIDATDDPLHGQQEGRFYHGYYGEYCYLPLYIFCGDFPLCASLHEADKHPGHLAIGELEPILMRIREVWQNVKIVLRGDSAFCTEDNMKWCEENGVDFILGLAKNERLKSEIADELEEAKSLHIETGKSARVFKDFTYKTLKSWSRERRIIGKAEHLAKGANPRFVVTSISSDEIDAKTLYEKEYCARGEMENRIKEQQLYLFADRTSTAFMRSNQLRLWFSTVAYVLINAFRHFALKCTELAKAQCHTIREKIFKIGALVKISARRIYLSLASGYPYEHIFQKAYENLQGG